MTFIKTQLIAAAFVISSMFSYGGDVTILPAELPYRPDPVVAGRLKVRVTRESLRKQPMWLTLEQHGLNVLYPVLPYYQSITSQQYLVPGLVLTNNLDELLTLEEKLLRTAVVEFKSDMPPERLVAALRVGCSDFEVAEPVAVAHPQGIPNDSLIDKQAMMKTLKTFEAWDVEQGSPDVVIGISDSGVMQEHEDLKDALYIRTSEIPDNNIDDDANGYVDDYKGYNFSSKEDEISPGNTFNKNNSHGTGVAGICGATVNNVHGIAGIANKCRMFPLKTMPDKSSSIIYGYESIMYAALNNFHVVNCSWGSQSWSCIDQDVVSYAIARGTAVVAAAGNHGTTAYFYPAAHNGVLAVGVTSPADNFITMSGRGSFVDVMAPGQETTTTDRNGGYQSFCCTSGSAPIVSGMIGLIRSHWPDLTPLEACALAKVAVDDISAENMEIKDLIPGRVNILKGVTMRPDSVPSVELRYSSVMSSDPIGRWGVGDTIDVRTSLVNYLAEFKGVKIDAEIVGEMASAVRLISNTASIERIPAKDSVTLPSDVTRLFIVGETDTTAFVKYTISGTTTAGEPHSQRLLLPVTPSPAYVNLANNVVALSVGDRCKISNTDIDRSQGIGLRYKGFCGQMYEGGMMINTMERGVDAVRRTTRANDHFRPVKRFRSPDALTGICTDADAPDTLRLGVEITQHVKLAGGDTAMFISDITIRNTSDTTLDDVSAGWFFDWDLGAQPVHNTIRRLDAYTQLVESTDTSRVVALTRIIPIGTKGQPVITGINNAITYSGFPLKNKIMYLHPTSPIAFNDTGDVSAIVGVRYRDGLAPGEEQSYRLILIMADSPAEALALAGANILPDYTDVIIGTPYPNPANATVTLPLQGYLQSAASLSVYDMQGRKILSQEVLPIMGLTAVTIETSMLSAGVYMCAFDYNGIRTSRPISVVH